MPDRTSEKQMENQPNKEQLTSFQALKKWLSEMSPRRRVAAISGFIFGAVVMLLFLNATCGC